MYGTIQIKLNVDDAVRDYLTYQCKQANSLINSTLFQIRQAHFDTCDRIEFFDRDGLYHSEFKTKRVQASYAEVCKQMQDNPHYKALGGQCAQQTLKSVVESFKSFNELLGKFWNGEILHKPKMPNYREKGGLAPIAYPAQSVQFDLETGECRISISRELKEDVHEHLQTQEIRLNGPNHAGIKPEQIAEVRILPKNREFYVEYVYEYGNQGASCNLALDPTQALGIDPGLDNWLTCVSMLGKSFIIDGRKLKSMNRNYNRRVAQLKTGQPAKYWDDQLAQITERRNRQMRDAINKAARFVVNYCLKQRIGRIVFGWNKGIKNEINLGKQTNQNFVQVPTARLKNRIAQLCEVEGIQFTETEESYTSQASFVDNDFLLTFGEKPKSWKPSGKRVHRGLYETANGMLINADCNGAANIIRKVAAQLGIVLTEAVRAALTLPKRYDVFRNLKKSYNRCETVFQPV